MRAPMIVLAVAALLTAGCEPVADSQYPDGGEPAAASDQPGETGIPSAPPDLDNEVTPEDDVYDFIIGAANSALSEQVGLAVRIEPEIFRSEGPWAFVYGPVRQPDGAPVDWSATALADAEAEGMMDGDLGIVLLNWTDGGWNVVESAIGPTDVPQNAWSTEHPVSPALLGLEG